MTGNDALEALLGRLAASYDGSAFFSATELRQWPKAAVSALTKSGLLTKAAPASSATCDGCERQCHMPVEIVSRAGRSAAFVVCDKRPDINRVDVPLEKLERWQASGEAVADFLAEALGINRSPGVAMQGKGWSVGMLRGKHAAHVVLINGDTLTLELAGHVVPLVEVLLLKGSRLELQRQTLIDRVDHPVAGGGTPKSFAERRAEMLARRDQLKASGIRNFLKVLAGESGISVSRVKQILEPPKTGTVKKLGGNL